MGTVGIASPWARFRASREISPSSPSGGAATLVASGSESRWARYVRDEPRRAVLTASTATFERNASFDVPFDVDMSGLRSTTAGAPYDGVTLEIVVRNPPPQSPGSVRRSVDVDGKHPGAELTLSAIRRLLMRDGVAIPVEIKRSGERLTVSLTLKRIV